MDSMSVTEGHFWIYSSILPKPCIQVMLLLVTIQVSKHLYVFQNTVLFFVIYNAVETYPETDNSLGNL